MSAATQRHINTLFQKPDFPGENDKRTRATEISILRKISTVFNDLKQVSLEVSQDNITMKNLKKLNACTLN